MWTVCVFRITHLTTTTELPKVYQACSVLFRMLLQMGMEISLQETATFPLHQHRRKTSAFNVTDSFHVHQNFYVT